MILNPAALLVGSDSRLVLCKRFDRVDRINYQKSKPMHRQYPLQQGHTPHDLLSENRHIHVCRSDKL